MRGSAKYVLTIGLAFAAATPAIAQTDYQPDPQALVGRISLTDGQVSFHAAGAADNDWSQAQLNYPVVAGDALWTEPGARAEIQVGDAELRLDNATEAEVSTLNDQSFIISVPQGTVNLHVGANGAGVNYQLVLPTGAVTVTEPGTYRIAAGGNGAPAQIAVLHGQAELNENSAAATINAGETAIMPAQDLAQFPDGIEVRVTQPTPFDNWSLTRDNYDDPRAGAQWQPAGATGFQDLDNYGQWQAVPAYGTVWFPTRMSSNWVPYRYGRWDYIAPWGWTWIDDAPWGFAPFHYGRWQHFARGWAWIPGPAHTRAVYAPALVTFIGGAPGHNNARPIGWVPLAPGEAYRPAYHASARYLSDININVHIGNAHDDYRNHTFATSMPAHDFVQAQQAQHHMAPMPHRMPMREPERQLPPATHNVFAPSAHPHDRPTPMAVPAPQWTREQTRETTPHEQVQREQQSVQKSQPAQHTEQPRHEVVPVTQSQPVQQPVVEHHVEPQRHEAAPIAQIQPVQPQPVQAQPAQQPHVQQVQPVIQQQAAPQAVQQPVEQHQEMRHIELGRPVQAQPLTPSHEGWVRREPVQQQPQAPQHQEQHAPAPQQHAEPAHQEVPHAQPQQPVPQDHH